MSRTRSIALAALLFSGAAHAEPTPQEAAAAEALFTDGVNLTAQGRYAEACPKFEASQHIDPGTGTRLNLALCYEALGKYASAWSQFRDVISEAKGTTRADRARTAQQHADALSPRLSYLAVAVPAAARVEGLVVQVDGARREPALFGVELPVDGGAHTVEASAPGYKPFRAQIAVAPERDHKSIEIAPLEPLPRPPPVVDRDRTSAPKRVEPPVVEESSRPLAGWLLVGTGVAALGVGAAFGFLALEQNEKSVTCGGQASCPKDEGYVWANRYGWIANIAIPVGLITGGVGAYLLLVPSSKKRAAAPSPGTPVVHGAALDHGAAVRLEGAW